MSPFQLKRLLDNRSTKHLLLTPLVDKFLLTHELSDFTEEEIELATRLMRKWSEPRQQIYHSPSSSGDCLRMQTLHILGYKGTQIDDPFLLNIFDDGNWRHLRWHTIFKRMERAGLLRVVAIEEFIKYKPWWVGGTPDDVLEIDTPNGKVRVVVDVKGANKDTFNRVKQTNEPLYEWHKMQLHSYMQSHAISRGIMWYECKDNQDYIEIPVLRDMSLVKAMRRRYKILKRARETRILPEHGCSMKAGDQMFERCRQRKNCIKLTNEGY